MNSLAQTLMNDFQFSSLSGTQTLEFGDRVRLADSVSTGEAGAVYQYMGTSASIDLSSTDASTVDYTDLERWKKLNTTNIIPSGISSLALRATGIDGATGGSLGNGGLVARNDVTASVQAYVDKAVIISNDQDINIIANEAARISAEDTSVISTGSGGNNGVLVSNLVLANAEARATDSDLTALAATADMGNVSIEAMNEAVIDALAHGSVSGKEALGFTVALNTLGWNAQDVVTQTLDAIIGAPTLADTGTPDHRSSDSDFNDPIFISFGDTVEIESDIMVGGDTIPAGTYIFQGPPQTDGSLLPNAEETEVTLSTETYLDTDRWRLALVTDVFGGEQPSGARAFLQDTIVTADGGLTVSATSEAQLAADVSTASTSEKANNAAVRAAHGTSSQASGGIISSNKVSSQAQAFIDNSGIIDATDDAATDDAINVGGDLNVFATDTPGDNADIAADPDFLISEVDPASPLVAVAERNIVRIDDVSVLTSGQADAGGTYRYLGGAENIDLLTDDYADTDRWELLRPAGIEASISLEVVSSATNTLSDLRQLAENIGNTSYDYTTRSGTQVLSGGVAAALGVDRIVGNSVFLSNQFISDNSLEDSAGDALRTGVYEYIGVLPLVVNLGDAVAADYDDESKWQRWGQTDFEDIFFPEIGNVSESNSTAAGGMVVLNDVRGQVEAYIESAEATVGGDINVESMEDASIRAHLLSNVSSSGGSNLGEGTSQARQGQIVTNLVLSQSDAFIIDSDLVSTGSSGTKPGDLNVKAENAALIDATLLASTQTGDEAVGITLAFNTIGWKPQNVLFNAVDALLGDPLISKAFDGEDPARTQAYILNSSIDIAGSLDLQAIGNTQLNSTVSNISESAASALKGAGGSAYGGILSSNKVSTDVRAFIDYNSVDFMSDDVGEQKIRPGDWVEIPTGSPLAGKVFEYQGRVANLLLDETEQNYQNNSNWKEVVAPIGGYTTVIESGGSVNISAQDNAGVYSNIKVVADSVTTNDGGASAIQETINDLQSVDYDTGNPLFDVSAGGTKVQLQFGDKVRLSDSYDTSLGQPGSVYRYMGADIALPLDALDLASQNYHDLDFWRLEPQSQLIPQGLNIDGSVSKAVGGLVVLNDVRTGVDAFINESTITADDGNISVSATENATLSAVSDSAAISSGGGSVNGSQGSSDAIGGTISTNVVQGSTQAYITESDVTASDADVSNDDGSILVAARNTSTLNAETKQATTSGGSVISALVAFNTVGWQEQNILFQSVDALLGTPIGNENPSMASAFIEDTVFSAAGDLMIQADNEATLNATISNKATAASAAMTGASASSLSGILASNRVSSGAEAYISNPNEMGEMTVGRDVLVEAIDDASIDATTNLESISSASNDAGAGVLNDYINLKLGDYHYTTSSGEQAVEFGQVVRVNGADYVEGGAGFDTLTVLTTGDIVTFSEQGTYQYAGPGIDNGIEVIDLTAIFDPLSAEWSKLSADAGQLYQYQGSIDFDYANDLVLAQPADLIKDTTIVRVDFAFEFSLIEDPESSQRFYKWVGDDELGVISLADVFQQYDSNDNWERIDVPAIDLSDPSIDFNNKSDWKLLSQDNVVPKAILTTLLSESGLSVSSSKTTGLSGLVARNDVRSDVDAFIIDTTLTVTDGDIQVIASEQASITAFDKSVLSASAAANAGVIVNNLVLSDADAFIQRSTVQADGAANGNVSISANNSSTIDAYAEGTVKSGGDAFGFTVAFNTIGWEAQDLLTQSIDAIIGAPHIAEANTPDHQISSVVGTQDLDFRSTVSLDDISGPSFTGSGVEGKLYEWQGDAEEGENLNLLDENYLDQDRWRQVLDLDVFGGEQPASASAYVSDSSISTENNLTLTAISEAQLAAEITNASAAEKNKSFAISAKYGANTSAAGGLLAGNKSSQSASAFIDNSGLADSAAYEIDVGNDLTIYASDTAGDNDAILADAAFKSSEFTAGDSTVNPRDIVQIDDFAGLVDAAVEELGFYRFIGEITEDIDLQNEDYTDEARWQQLRAAGIEALLHLEASSTSTSTLDSLRGAVGFLGGNDYEYTTSSGTQQLDNLDRIFLSQAWINANTDPVDALTEGIYAFLGLNNTVVDLDEADYADISTWQKYTNQDLEDILFPNIGNVQDSNSTAYGGMVVMNEVRGVAEAFITNADVSSDGDIDIDAIEDSSIRAIAKSTVSSSGGSNFGNGTSLAVSGQIVTNLVLSEARAFISESDIETTMGNGGNVEITADNAALLDATLRSSTQTGDTAVGISLAFNSVGWNPQNILFNAIDALLGDPLISKAFDGQNPAKAHAFITDTAIDADGSIQLQAFNNAQINATTSNAAESNASALKGASGAGYGALLSSNKVSGEAKAWIDGSSSITAGGSVDVTAQDNTGIYANTKLVASSITTNDGGASAIQETLNDLVNVDFDTGQSTLSSSIDLKFGDRIRLADDFAAGTGNADGAPGVVYRFLGDELAGVDLNDIDYTNLDLFKAEPETELIPQGFNVSDSNSRAVGGLIVVNDVRAGVEAYIDQVDVTAEEGDINVSALENASIIATTDGTVVSSGGSALGDGESLAINGIIATNLVQSVAKAYAKGNTLTASSTVPTFGNINIDARNTSRIDATTKGSVQSGDTAVGVLLAFNSVGWKASNILFNAVDTLIGDPAISNAFDGAGQGSVTAYLEDVTVVADGDVTVSATSNSNITANLSNDATSAASALKGAEGKAVGVVLSSNKVNSITDAYIDNSSTVVDPLNPDIDAQGSVIVTADDDSSIIADSTLKAESTVTNDFGLSAAADLADALLGSYQYTTNSGEQEVESGELVYIASTYTDGDGEKGSVYRYLGPKATIDLGAVNYDEPNILDDPAGSGLWLETNPIHYSSGDGEQMIQAGIPALDFLPAELLPEDISADILGTIVRVSDGHGGTGEVGADYRYVGGDQGSMQMLDLSMQDFEDTDNWVRVTGNLTTLLNSQQFDSLNLNFSDSNSTAAGALIVMNDVRSDVDAYIENSAVDAGVDLQIGATQSATITATDESVVTSDGGSVTGKGTSTAINGVIATNVVLSEANAEIRNSDVLTGGLVDIDASNTSTIDSSIESSVKSKGNSIGLTLAFNSIGYNSQNFLFNTIDALIGSSIADSQPASTVAKILNSEVGAGTGIDIDARGTTSITAQVLNSNAAVVGSLGESESFSIGAIIAMNKLNTLVAAEIDGGNLVETITGDINLFASDDSDIDSDVAASAVSMSVGLTKARAVAIGASIARNEIDNSVLAQISNVVDINSNEDLIVYASQDAQIDSSSVATAVSMAVSGTGTNSTIAVSGGLSWSTNIINGGVQAGIDNSSVATGGYVDIDALNTSAINAIINTTAVSISAAGSGNAVAGAIGVSIARNFVAFDEAHNYSSSSLNTAAYDWDTAIGIADQVEQGDRVKVILI